MRRLGRRCQKPLYAFIASSAILAIGFGILMGLADEYRSTKLIPAFAAGVIMCFAAWGSAAAARATIQRTKDSYLFSFTPMTYRMYVLRNVLYSWPVSTAVFIGVPVIAVLTWKHSPDVSGLAAWDMHTVVNAVLAYLAIVLLVLDKPGMAVQRMTHFVFFPRHIIARFSGIFVVVAVLLSPVNRFTDGAVMDAVERVVTTFLEFGFVSYVISSVLFPITAPFIQAANPNEQSFAVLTTVLFGAVIAAELAALAKIFTLSHHEWDAETSQEWVEHRDEIQEDEAVLESQQDLEIEDWLSAARRSTDREDTDYNETIHPERQLYRHANRISRLERSSQNPLALTTRLLLENIGLALLILMWAVVLGNPGGKTAHDFVLIAALILSLYMAYFPGFRYSEGWLNALAFPYRHLKFLIQPNWSQVPKSFIKDLLAAGLIVSLVGFRVEGFILMLLTINAIRIVGRLGAWLGQLGGTGKKWMFSWHQFALVIYGFALIYPIILLVSSEKQEVSKFAFAFTFMMVSSFVLICFSALLVAWAHRRTDTSFLRSTDSASW